MAAADVEGAAPRVQVVVDGLAARACCVDVLAAVDEGGSVLRVSVADILAGLAGATAMPVAWLRLTAGGRPLAAAGALLVERRGAGGSLPLMLRATVAGALRGGKGGFGAMLRASGASQALTRASARVRAPPLHFAPRRHRRRAQARAVGSASRTSGCAAT